MDREVLQSRPFQKFDIREIAKHMPRDRHQDGWVEEVGKHVRKWKGHWYEYYVNEAGQEKRRHHAPILGLKSKMRKWEAEAALRGIIEKATLGNQLPIKPDDRTTFGWFWQYRYLPMKRAEWKPATAYTINNLIQAQLIPEIGETALRDLNKFQLQQFLNSKADRFSRSVVTKCLTFLRASLDEAVELGFLLVNPARKLKLPKTRATCTRFLSSQEIQTLLRVLEKRDRIIFRLFLLCALRPGELFALRWADKAPGKLRISRAVYRGRVGTTKTKTSTGFVALPPSLDQELEFCREQCGSADPEDYIFSSRTGTPLDGHNYLRRFLAPKAKQHGIEGVTFQSLRRTFATHVHGLGTIKDAQAQLRHADIATTLGIYTQEIPESVRKTVEELDEKLFGQPQVATAAAGSGGRVN